MRYLFVDWVKIFLCLLVALGTLMGWYLMGGWRVMPTKICPLVCAAEPLTDRGVPWPELSYNHARMRTIKVKIVTASGWLCLNSKSGPRTSPVLFAVLFHFRKPGCVKWERSYTMSPLVSCCVTWGAELRDWWSSPSPFPSWGGVPFCLVFLYPKIHC